MTEGKEHACMQGYKCKLLHKVRYTGPLTILLFTVHQHINMQVQINLYLFFFVATVTGV